MPPSLKKDVGLLRHKYARQKQGEATYLKKHNDQAIAMLTKVDLQ